MQIIDYTNDLRYEFGGSKYEPKQTIRLQLKREREKKATRYDILRSRSASGSFIYGELQIIPTHFQFIKKSCTPLSNK